MKKMLRLLSAVLAAAAIMSAGVTGAVAARDFPDVKDHWAEAFVKKAVERGYVNGYEDGTFKPNNPIKRAEFAKLLNSALGLTATTAISFKDVTTDHWYHSEVQKAVAAGYISGYDDGTFLGDNLISRQEAALVIARIVTGSARQGDITTLKDSASIADWAMDGARTVFSKGYMTGDDQKKFNPAGNLTRAEAVKIIESILGSETIVKDNLIITESGQTFSDKIYVGSVVASAQLGSGNVTFNNCSILGTMLINGGDSSGVRLANTRVSNMTVNNTANRVGVTCLGSATVSNTYVSTPCSLDESNITGLGRGFTNVTLGGSGLANQTVVLNGDYDNVTVSNRAGLNLNTGSIKKLTVNSAAADSSVTLGAGATVDTAVINAKSSFLGAGKINKAEQNVKDVSYAVRPGTVTGSGAATTPAKAVKITMSPTDGSVNMATTVLVNITFDDSVKNADNGALTAAYVQNTAVQLRRDSATGTSVPFTATVTTDAKRIVLTPQATLAEGTTYYVVIPAGVFRSSDGTASAAMTTSFKTVAAAQGDGPVPTAVTPVNNSKDNPVSTQITLEFADKVMAGSGANLTAAYVRSSSVELRRGSRTGTAVDFTAAVSSNGKRIVITPSKVLSVDTKYYVVLPAGGLSDANGVKNKEQVFTFTTAVTDYAVPTVTPSSGSTGIDTDTEFTFEFEEPMYNKNLSSLTGSYLRSSVFTIRQNSSTGSKVSFTASISSDKKTVTLVPDDLLAENTTYYISIAEGSMLDRNYEEVPALSFTFTTGGKGSTSGRLSPTATSPTNGKTNVGRDTSITITYADALTTGTGTNITAGYIEDYITLRRGSSTGSVVGFDGSISSNRKTITLKPRSALAANTRYYVSIEQGAFRNASNVRSGDYSFSFTVGSSLLGGELAPYDTEPRDGARNVSATTDITLYFDEALYQSNGRSAITSSYLSNTAIELRRNSRSGSKVSFSGGISSNRKTVTLSPTMSLSEGTYYVILKDGTVSDSAGNLNDEYTFSFSVSAAASTGVTPTSVVPANGSSNVSADTIITLNFGGSMYRTSSRTALTATHVRDRLEIRRGANSTGAPKTQYSAAVSSDGSVVTISPNMSLEPGTTYYIYIPSGTFYNAAGQTSSSALTYSFTTRAASAMTAPTMAPANGSSDISPSLGQITLTYPEALLTSSNGTVNSSYITSNVKLTKDSPAGSPVSFSASVGSNRIINLIPNEPLAHDTTYYVTAAAGVFRNSSGTSSQALSYNFSTAKPSLSITADAGKTDASLKVTYDYTGAANASFRLICGSTTVMDSFSPKTQQGSFTETVDGLNEGTTYRATVTLTYGSGKQITDSVSFTTGVTSGDSALTDLSVEDLKGIYHARLSSASGGKATAEVVGELEPDGGRLTITATPSSDKATVEIDGTAGRTRTITVPSGADSHSVVVTVTAENGAITEYTLTMPIKR